MTSGCGQTPAMVPVGLLPVAIFADAANHTVYITNADAGRRRTTVSMLDSATCNAHRSGRLPDHAPADRHGRRPSPADVDVAVTHTVYVTTIGALGRSNGVAVFDANTCNATVQSGCDHDRQAHCATADPPTSARGRLGQPHPVHGQRRQHDLGVRPAQLQRRRPGWLRHRTRPAR